MDPQHKAKLIKRYVALTFEQTLKLILWQVRRGWNTRTQGRQDQREAVAWQKREHRFGSMVIERQ
jgi:hypothetical protein